jgi:hypothetical protein
MPASPATVERVVQDCDDRDQWNEVGRVAVGDRGTLSLLEARPVYRDYLTEMVETINGLDRLKIKIPPPPGSEPFSIFSKTVTRDHPELLGVIADYAEQNFGLRLADPESLAASGDDEPPALPPWPEDSPPRRAVVPDDPPPAEEEPVRTLRPEP